MKTTPLNRASKCLSMLALLCCLLFNRAQAQWIPIDSGFAGILLDQGFGCIVDYQLDTNCAKAATPFNITPLTTPSNGKVTRSLDGMQYIGKNFEGQPTMGRTLIIDTLRKLSFIPNLPAIYQKVYITGADSLLTAPYPGDSATIYYIWMSGVTQVVQLPNTLTEFTSLGNHLTSLPTLPSGLVLLNCGSNELTSLPALPQSLTTIYTDANHLSTLPTLPNSLEVLYCESNQLTSLPGLPTSLKELHCSNNQLTSLPNLNNVSFLDCSRNLLMSIPQLPLFFTHLNCASNQLTSLPTLPASLITLRCGNNQIDQLPQLEFTSITELYCSYNNIRVIPRLPNPQLNPGSIILVVADHNEIDSVTNFPNLLRDFVGDYNNISALPPLNDTLRALSLDNNNISSLPPLPSSLRILSVNSNPIVCLPPLPNFLESISYLQTGVNCIPNLPLALTQTLPVCSDTRHCFYSGISGRVYIDKNDNCNYDGNDVALIQQQLEVDGVGYALTDSSGYYRFIANEGAYNVEALNVGYPLSLQCTQNNIGVQYNGIDTLGNIDFPLHIVDYCAKLSVDISTPVIRIAVPNTHTVIIKNTGTEVATNVQLKVKFELELTPLSSVPAWDQWIANNTLVYNFDTLQTQQQITITIVDSTSITAVMGQTACVMASIMGDGLCGVDTSANWDRSNLEVSSEWEAGEDSVQFFIKNTGSTMTGPTEYRIYEEELLMFKDNIQITMLDSLRLAVPANGKTHRVEVDQRPFFPTLSKPRSFMELAGGPPFSLNHIIPVPQDDDDEWIEIDCRTIVNGYDPNAKEVQPSGVGSSHYITASDELEYHLMFQNTGNDTAFNIKLIDTLDATKLDIETFRSGVSSHPYTVSMQGNGIVTWRFANIQLPDSHVNEPLSHGFVKFKIKQKQGNQPGAVINNFVDIYFDYNTPVRTNTAFVTIEEKDRIFSAIVEPRNIANGYTISVMPNPFAEEATVSIASKYANSNNYTFELFDITGRTVQSKQVEGTFNINRDGLTGGMYLFKITENGKPVGNGKLIVK